MSIKLKLMKKACPNCLFGPHKIVTDESKSAVIQEALEDNTFFQCHQADLHDKPELQGCCAGFYAKHKDDVTYLRLINFLQQQGCDTIELIEPSSIKLPSEAEIQGEQLTQQQQEQWLWHEEYKRREVQDA